MDKTRLKKLVPEIVKRILSEDGIERVILFGSSVEGNLTKDSDLDLLVVKETITNRYQEMIHLRRLLKGLGTPIDLLVIGHDDFQEKLHSPSNIYYWANKSGKVIYDTL